MQNTFFENMRNEGRTYEAAKELRKAEKKALMDADNWDAVKAWNEREEREFPFPFTGGAMKAFNAYENTNYKHANAFLVTDLPWERDIPDFVETLREAGITEIAIADQSTSLMESLHTLAANGCQMTGLTKVEIDGNGWTEPERITVNGITMTIA